MIHRTLVAVALVPLLMLCARTSLAIDVPGPPITPELEASQVSADAAFKAGDYEKAFRICMDDLAPNGDKYAQYMIGLMNLHGRGVPQDIPLGAAWLELAAERGDSSLETVRDDVKAQLTDDEQHGMQPLLDEIRGQYGDCAMVGRLLAEDEGELTALTGSRVRATGSQPITTLYGNQFSGPDSEQMILRRVIHTRKRFLHKNCE